MGKGMQAGISIVVVALVVTLIGLVLAPTIITNAITAATTTGIGSFGGVAALLGLVPLGFVILIVWYIFQRMRAGKG
jgi:hypothetical protein